MDFNPEDFIARVSDLIGKYVNIASRAASFITKHFDGHRRQAAERRASKTWTSAGPRTSSPASTTT